MKFKTPKQEAEFYSLEICPYLFWKLSYLDNRSKALYGVELEITSIHRSDGSSHDHEPYRASDLSVKDLTDAQIADLKKHHDKYIKRFGTFDSFFRHDVGRGDHIHSQRPKMRTLCLVG